MKNWFVELQRALLCGGVADGVLNARRTPWQRAVRVLARHFGVETLNQSRDRAYPILILLAGHGAYADSSLTVAGR